MRISPGSESALGLDACKLTLPLGNSTVVTRAAGTEDKNTARSRTEQQKEENKMEEKD